ncbi:hypothetical protein LX36DRAFT_662552 [Colletotrichum falcatum]|nr:hypothetical protein LX36DRAFT_662552 [Colletotrichum falcatum]
MLEFGLGLVPPLAIYCCCRCDGLLLPASPKRANEWFRSRAAPVIEAMSPASLPDLCSVAAVPLPETTARAPS